MYLFNPKLIVFTRMPTINIFKYLTSLLRTRILLADYIGTDKTSKLKKIKPKAYIPITPLLPFFFSFSANNKKQCFRQIMKQLKDRETNSSMSYSTTLQPTSSSSTTHFFSCLTILTLAVMTYKEMDRNARELFFRFTIDNDRFWMSG